MLIQPQASTKLPGSFSHGMIAAVSSKCFVPSARISGSSGVLP